MFSIVNIHQKVPSHVEGCDFGLNTESCYDFISFDLGLAAVTRLASHRPWSLVDVFLHLLKSRTIALQYLSGLFSVLILTQRINYNWSMIQVHTLLVLELTLSGYWFKACQLLRLPVSRLSLAHPSHWTWKAVNTWDTLIAANAAKTFEKTLNANSL